MSSKRGRVSIAAAVWAFIGAGTCLCAQEINVVAPVKIKLGGSYQLEYKSSRDAADSIVNKKSRLRLKGNATDLPAVTFFLQSEFGQTPALLDMTLEYSNKEIAPFLDFRLTAGQFKPPFSREHLVNDDIIEILNRSAAVEALAPGRDTATKGRDIGAMAVVGAQPWGRQDFAVGSVAVINGEGANNADKNDQKDLVARFELNPRSFLSLGASYLEGRRGSPRTIKNRSGWDAKLSYGPVSATYEQIYGITGPTRAKGQYMLATAWLWSSVLQLSGRYDWFDPNLGKSGDRSFITTLGLNWYPYKILRLTLNNEIKREEGSQKGNDTIILSVLFFF